MPNLQTVDQFNCENARRRSSRSGESERTRASGRGTHRRPNTPATRGGRRDDAVQKPPHSDRHPWPPVPSLLLYRAPARQCVSARPCRRSCSRHSPAVWGDRAVSIRVIHDERQKLFNPSLDEEAGQPPAFRRTVCALLCCQPARARVPASSRYS